MISVGIDAGSATPKAALLNGGRSITPTIWTTAFDYWGHHYMASVKTVF